MIQCRAMGRGIVFALVTAVLALGWLFSAPSAYAQGAVIYASISGDVMDKSGRSVPNATVKITNPAIGLERTAQTDDQGHFVVLQLPAGSYKVEIEHPSFKKATIADLVLKIGEQHNVRIEMEVGDLREVVEVKGDEITIATTQTEVANEIAPLQVRELPLNQRSFTSLVTQQPGLVQITNTAKPSVLSSATNSGSYISADGLMGTSVAYLMDGVNLSNGSFTAPGTAAAGDMPGVEAIQEFRVMTHTYSAAYGGASAAVVSFATRSGTNEIHGNVYEYLRNNIFDARAFFDREKPPFKRNQFGATLGGPIVRDKAFYFVNYEGLRQRLSTTDVAFVPNECARNSGVGGSGVGCTGGIPLTVVGCQVLNANRTCAAHGPVAISPGVQAILSLYPLPNFGNLNNDPNSGIGEYRFVNYQPTNQDFGLAHATWAPTSKDNLSARYSITDANSRQAFHVPTFQFTRSDRNQNVLLKWNRLWSQSWVTTVSFSFTRSNVQARTNETVQLQPSQYTGNPARKTIGVISVGAGSAGTTSGTLTLFGNDDASPLHVAKNVFPLNVDAIYTVGRHSIKFGGSISWYQWNWSSATITGGSYTFNTLNDFLAGNPGVALIHRDGPESSYMLRTTLFGWYIEDSWRVSQKVTIVAGIRHDFQNPILKDKLGRLGNWRYQTDSAVTVGEPFNNYSLKQFQPRIGIAYDPWGRGKTVIRAGFGLFNDFIDYAGNGQGQLQWNAPQPVLNTFFGDPLAPGFLPVTEFPTCTACTAPGPYFGLVTGVLNPVYSPTSVQWSLQVQQQLPWNFILTGTYAGSHSYHIPRKIEGNHNLPCSVVNGEPIFPTAPPGCGTAAPAVSAVAFSLYSKLYDAHANYNALMWKVTRQTSDFTFAASYSFAKGLSESDSVNSGNVVTGISQASQYPANRRLDRSESLFSIRHRFTANFIYDLPFGKGKKFATDATGAKQAFVGGWQLSTLMTFQSGVPFSVLAGVPITGVGDNIDFPDRPNIVSTNTTTGDPNAYINLLAYALQAPGRLGNAPRTSARGPGFHVIDFGIGKSFTITEQIGLKFRADFFNLFNHPNFGLPFNQLYVASPSASPQDGARCNLTPAQSASFSCNPQAGRISTTVGVPRQVQFSLKLSF